MNLIRYLWVAVLATVLAACGGGGGSAGNPGGVAPVVPVVPPLFTTAPTSLTIALGASQEFSISGGASPYSVVSNDASVAIAGVSGSKLTIGGITAGAAGVSIRDAVGATVAITVSVKGPVVRDLFTTAASSVIIPIGQASAQTYNVGGGTGPYSVTSSNVSVASAVLTGNSLRLTGIAVGSANIVIRDNIGASITVAMTVQPISSLALFTTAPASVTVAVASAPTYTVGGGTGPYIVSSSNTNVAAVSLVDNTLTVNGAAVGSANIVVRDSVGASITVAVTVQPAGNLALFTTAPASVTVAVGTSSAYTVGGGSGSGYLATSTNIGVVTASLTGTTLTVTGVATGSAGVVVRDSAGATVTVTVLVGAIPLFVTPNGATGIIEDTLLATITGGTPPYRASVGNTLVATAVIQNSNELRIQLLQVGSTIVTLLDANNQSVAYTVNANAATPGIRLSPGVVSVSEFDAQPIVFTVFGAAAGTVNVFSSDVTLLSAAVADTRPATLPAGSRSGTVTVTVTSGSRGNRCVDADLAVTITVIDSTRATGVATVTVRDNGGVCPPVP